MSNFEYLDTHLMYIARGVRLSRWRSPTDVGNDHECAKAARGPTNSLSLSRLLERSTVVAPGSERCSSHASPRGLDEHLVQQEPRRLRWLVRRADRELDHCVQLRDAVRKLHHPHGRGVWVEPPGALVKLREALQRGVAAPDSRAACDPKELRESASSGSSDLASCAFCIRTKRSKAARTSSSTDAWAVLAAHASAIATMMGKSWRTDLVIRVPSMR